MPPKSAHPRLLRFEDLFFETLRHREFARISVLQKGTYAAGIEERGRISILTSSSAPSETAPKTESPRIEEFLVYTTCFQVERRFNHVADESEAILTGHSNELVSTRP